MVKQRLQDGGSSILPTTQKLTMFSLAKSPTSLPHPVVYRCGNACLSHVVGVHDDGEGGNCFVTSYLYDHLAADRSVCDYHSNIN
jgi:hypothetical protein